MFKELNIKGGSTLNKKYRTPCPGVCAARTAFRYHCARNPQPIFFRFFLFFSSPKTWTHIFEDDSSKNSENWQNASPRKMKIRKKCAPWQSLRFRHSAPTKAIKLPIQPALHIDLNSLSTTKFPPTSRKKFSKVKNMFDTSYEQVWHEIETCWHFFEEVMIYCEEVTNGLWSFFEYVPNFCDDLWTCYGTFLNWLWIMLNNVQKCSYFLNMLGITKNVLRDLS